MKGAAWTNANLRAGLVGTLVFGLSLLLPTWSRAGGCTRDVECKGNRICENGRCIDPDNGTDAQKGSGVATPIGEPQPVASPQETPIPAQLAGEDTLAGPASPAALSAPVPQPEALGPAPVPPSAAVSAEVPAVGGSPTSANAAPPPSWAAHPAGVTANPPPPASTGSRPLRITGMVCGAAGLASIATGVIFYARARSLSASVASAQAFSPSDDAAGNQAETLQWVFYSAGGVAVGVGMVLYFLGRPSASADSHVALQVSPMLLRGGAGVSAGGTF
jgi:hypothetical protein